MASVPRPVAAVSLFLAVIGAPRLAVGQRVQTPRFPAPLYAQLLARSGLVADSQHRKIPPTHWLEGAAVGALAMSLVSYGFAHGLCEERNCVAAALEAAPFGAMFGAGVGALIGGQFPMKPAAKNRLWTGVLIGGIAVAVAGAIYEKGSCQLTSCSSQTLDAAAIFGGVGTVVGALIGGSIAKHPATAPPDTVPH